MQEKHIEIKRSPSRKSEQMQKISLGLGATALFAGSYIWRKIGNKQPDRYGGALPPNEYKISDIDPATNKVELTMVVEDTSRERSALTYTTSPDRITVIHESEIGEQEIAYRNAQSKY